MGEAVKGDLDFADLFPALQKTMGLGNVFKREDSSDGRFQRVLPALNRCSLGRSTESA
jgi:hypothetical protein